MPEGLTDAQIITRIERLERQVRMLAERAGVEIEDPNKGIDPEVLALVREGNRMNAAKLYAERTGSDFVTAQRVVNELV